MNHIKTYNRDQREPHKKASSIALIIEINSPAANRSVVGGTFETLLTLLIEDAAERLC